MHIHLLAKAAATVALCLPLMATADITYTYRGKAFNNVNTEILMDGDTPEQNAANTAAAAAALAIDRVRISFSSPVYLPDGWSNFSTVGAYSGALAASLQALADGGTADPGISWKVQTSLFSGDGHISLQFDGASFDWNNASRLNVSVHADSNHNIDAWEISMEPGYGVGAFSWARELSSSSSDGDRLLFENAGNHYYDHREAANASAGRWSVTDGPVSPTPEPAPAAMLLSGLGMLGLLQRRRRHHPRV